MRHYHVKMREAMESCLLGEALSASDWEQRQLKPPTKLSIRWANAKSSAAPNPSMKALWLGSLHSNIHNLKCLTCSIGSNLKQPFHLYTNFKNETSSSTIPCFVQFQLQCLESQLWYPSPQARDTEKLLLLCSFLGELKVFVSGLIVGKRGKHWMVHKVYIEYN